jgi:hypothetical protein
LHPKMWQHNSTNNSQFCKAARNVKIAVAEILK